MTVPSITARADSAAASRLVEWSGAQAPVARLRVASVRGRDLREIPTLSSREGCYLASWRGGWRSGL